MKENVAQLCRGQQQYSFLVMLHIVTDCIVLYYAWTYNHRFTYFQRKYSPWDLKRQYCMLADTTGCSVISATTFQNCAVATSFTGIGHIAYFLNPYSLLVWPMTKFETKALKKSHYNKISKTTEIEVAPKVVEILLKVGKQKRCILAEVHFSAISDFYRGP